MCLFFLEQDRLANPVNPNKSPIGEVNSKSATLMPPNVSVATLRGLVIFYVIRILPRLTPLGYIITPPAEAIIQ